MSIDKETARKVAHLARMRQLVLEEADRARRAEGLAFLPGGRIAIAGDRQDPGPNLAILAAPPGP